MHGHIGKGLIGAIALGLLATPAIADVKAGVDAWTAGDYAAAVREWAQPAADGDPDAQFNLAQAYRLGRGVEADPRQAEALYLLAAQQGHIKAADNYGLLLFQDGRREAAMPYVQAAAERGDPRAQYLLGVAHFNGDLVAKDWVRAYALATLANSAGLPQARSAIGQMDQYIPLEQRQEAQLLAGTLKSEAEAARASELAAVDLATGGGPVRVASAGDIAPRIAGQAGRAVPEPPVVVASAAPAEEAGADYTLPAPAPPAAVSAETEVAVQPASAVEQAPLRVSGSWKVQLGAFGVAGNAERLWERLADSPALAGKARLTRPSGRLTLLLAAGYASEADARRACASLKAGGQDCLVTQ